MQSKETNIPIMTENLVSFLAILGLKDEFILAIATLLQEPKSIGQLMYYAASLPENVLKNDKKRTEELILEKAIEISQKTQKGKNFQADK